MSNNFLVSIIPASVLCLMLIGGSIAEFIGRKRTLVIGQTIIILGWIIIYFSSHFSMLLVGRFFVGAGIGVCLPVTTLQLSEIALIKMRGVLSMMGYLFMNAGCVYSLTVGANLPLNILMIMAAIPSMFFLLISYFLPESPVWLMKKGYPERAKESLLQLRGPKYDMNHELKELENLVITQVQDNTKWIDKLKELQTRNNAIPFIIMSTIFLLQVGLINELYIL